MKDIIQQLLQMDRMDKSLDSVQRNFATVRTGRANPAMLDRIDVDYYGTSTPLKQIAGVSTPEATLLVIQPYDQTAIPAIERAIQQSDIGLTPNNDGKIIRLQIPQLTAVSTSGNIIYFEIILKKYIAWVTLLPFKILKKVSFPKKSKFFCLFLCRIVARRWPRLSANLVRKAR